MRWMIDHKHELGKGREGIMGLRIGMKHASDVVWRREDMTSIMLSSYEWDTL